MSFIEGTKNKKVLEAFVQEMEMKVFWRNVQLYSALFVYLFVIFVRIHSSNFENQTSVVLFLYKSISIRINELLIKINQNEAVSNALFFVSGLLSVCAILHILILIKIITIQIISILTLISMSILNHYGSQKLTTYADDNCNDKTGNSDLQKIDELYDMANTYICTEECPCLIGTIVAFQISSNRSTQLARIFAIEYSLKQQRNYKF
ncbi:UNKNOWN [Stylonychia lemnae]|uniref:Uncharacterized protein n=1 Tax=Stylonychia lemnae TaxID=5949 RepID=A0A078ALC3_STYLE|nr:UNKNOWN [Stylonychia lemnae]|eukprot:CDW83160.1 UNKNOWN [Stylonychia lemnae]